MKTLKFVALAALMGIGPVAIGHAIYEARHACHLQPDRVPAPAPLELRYASFTPAPLLAQAAPAPAPAAEPAPLPPPPVPGWLLWGSFLSTCATALLLFIQSIEAALLKAGWWSGKRRGAWLVIYTVLTAAAGFLGQFFPSRVERLGTNAAASTSSARSG